MRTWLQGLLRVCLRLIRVLLRWLRKPVRSRWARACSTSGPRRGWAQPKPHWVRREVVRLKALMADAGCRTIAHCFNRRFAARRGMTVGKTYVADTIRRQQYAILAARRRLRHARPRVVPRNLV